MNGRAGHADKRGSSVDRRRRRRWVLATFDPELGPDRARCRLRLSYGCLDVVDGDTLSVDRIELGGTYAHHNIQPACMPCQTRQGGLQTVRTMGELISAYRDAREAWELAFETAANRTYRPGIIEWARRKSRRGGRNEVCDFVDENPPPMFRDWLTDWAASRREADAGDTYGTDAG